MSATETARPAHIGTTGIWAALCLGIAALIGLFWPECRAAVRVWYDSTAYGHCFLVVPIVGYLIWDRRETLTGLRPCPRPAASLLAFPLVPAWLVAERLGIMEGQQLVAVAVLQVMLLTALGTRLYRALAGPLLYLFFLVPCGAFITPVLQAFTAHFIDIGLSLLGTPHFVNAMVIETPAGVFLVAEACAGLRFLIASIAFGVFFALLNYRSPGRRIAFIAASIVIPILANGMRALGIVVLGSILGSAQAAAADHLIYGWVFFSAVTVLLVLAGLPFREFPAATSPEPSPLLPPSRAAGAVFVVLVLAALGPAAAFALDSQARPVRLATQPALRAPEGCTVTPDAKAPPGRAHWLVLCANRQWDVNLQLVSGRKTGATLAEARRQLIGTYDADEAVTTPIAAAPSWPVVAVRTPGFVAATKTWIDGRPAGGGLGQRLTLALNSLRGTDHASAVMAFVWRASGDLSEGQLTEARSELGRILAAQPTLDDEVARTTAE